MTKTVEQAQRNQNKSSKRKPHLGEKQRLILGRCVNKSEDQAANKTAEKLAGRK
jgi:hypothetical protein